MNHGSVLPGNTRSGRSPFSPITASLPTPSLAARGAGEGLESVADHLAPPVLWVFCSGVYPRLFDGCRTIERFSNCFLRWMRQDRADCSRERLPAAAPGLGFDTSTSVSGGVSAARHCRGQSRDAMGRAEALPAGRRFKGSDVARRGDGHVSAYDRGAGRVSAAAVRDRGRDARPRNPEGEDYLDLWCSLTINLSGGPFASTWRIHTCARHHGHFTLVPGIMDMGVPKSADGAQAPVDSTFDEINRMFSKLGFIDYNSRLAQGPFYSPNLICLSHASRRRGGAFSRESIPVLLVRIPTCPYACCSAAFETSKPFDFRN